MRFVKTLLSVPIVALALTGAPDASACGGCFHETQSESTVVTGHRMIFSISQAETTLWDQIAYDAGGNPSDFAWVLPTKGVVEVGLSSDALFETLEMLSQVTIVSPTIDCDGPPTCDDFGASGTATGAGGGGAGGGPVDVIAQETVGPYDTVQLSSTDPNALTDWLLMNGYAIPPDIAPIIAAYVGEGFNFLALKLSAGAGVDAMRPVRVTTPGAGATLPLRMVAAGTGAITPITLWIMGEGRYEPQNFPSFIIREQDLIWDWDQQRSNYAELKKAGFDASNGAGWLIEAGEPISEYSIEYPLADLVQYSPAQSGYGDINGQGAAAELDEDLAKLYGGIPAGAVWINRQHAELTRQALANDLALGASMDQSQVQRYLLASQTVGSAPTCPTYPPCDDTTTYPNDEVTPKDEWTDIWGSGTCAVGRFDGGPAALGSLLLAAAVTLSRRRRR